MSTSQETGHRYGVQTPPLSHMTVYDNLRFFWTGLESREKGGQGQGGGTPELYAVG